MFDKAKNKTVILGLGVTGLSCARFLASKNQPFVIVDTREKPAMASEFLTEFKDHELYTGDWHQDILLEADYLIVSPGIGLKEPAIAKAIQAGAKIISDVDLLISVSKAPIAAITGSNGKTTVTSLLGEMAINAGLNTIVAGNIGLPVLDAYLQSLQSGKDIDLYVLELSSFQLERVADLNAQVACVLNVTPDHMDRYESLEDYAQTKRHIFSAAKNCVFNVNDSLTMPKGESINLSITERDKSAMVYCSSIDGEASAFGVDETSLLKGEDRLLTINELAIKGKHNQFNALVAYAMGEKLGLSHNAMVETLKTFTGLPHRCELIAQYKGIQFINDSKGTNEGACIAAIQGLASSSRKNIILIAGGDDKDADFSGLNSVVSKYVKNVVLIGRAQAKLKALLMADNEVLLAEDMDKALLAAFEYAKEGDIVLLSPACASFDMYKGFEHRGQVFQDSVNGLLEKETLV